VREITLVGLLGAAGALARYGIGSWAGATSFPWPTLAINVAGSFLLGLVLAAGPVKLDAQLTTGLAVGFLGGFTTYSSFSTQTHALLRTDRTGAAIAYVALSVLAGLAAAAVGYALGKAIVE
jgi:CrcB protein